jgi:hypothetical protein
MGTTTVSPGTQNKTVKVGPGTSVPQQPSGGCC